MSSQKEKEKEGQGPSGQKQGLQVPSQAEGMPQDDDEWANISDLDERRKVQNRIAQRKFRQRSKQRKEDSQRDSTNRRLAGSAYTTPEPEDLGERRDLSGVPWGSINMGHVIKSGKARADSNNPSQAGTSQQPGSDHRSGSS